VDGAWHVHDAQLVAAVDYLRRLRRGQREVTARRAQPHVAAALDLFKESGPPTWETDARLLAGQAPGGIADRVGIDVDTVRAYENLFFAVSEARGAGDWIIACVLHRTPWTTGEPIEAALWRYFGWVGGPEIVDLLVAEHFGRPEPTHPERAVLAEQARAIFKLQFGDARAAAAAVDEVSKLRPELVAREPMWPYWRTIIRFDADCRMPGQRAGRRAGERAYDDADDHAPHARRRRGRRALRIPRLRITPLTKETLR
jgi:hypothetical protein